jgi:hypothetical protein
MDGATVAGVAGEVERREDTHRALACRKTACTL